MAYAREDEDEFVRRVIENKLAVQRTEQEQSKRKLEKQRRRITELDAITQRLYEANVTGKLSDERFAKLSAAYEAEQAELKQSVESLSVIVEASEAQAVNVRSFLKIVKKYTEPTALTPQLLHEFVDKIVVHKADKSSGLTYTTTLLGRLVFSRNFAGKRSNSMALLHQAVTSLRNIKMFFMRRNPCILLGFSMFSYGNVLDVRGASFINPSTAPVTLRPCPSMPRQWRGPSTAPCRDRSW